MHDVDVEQNICVLFFFFHCVDVCCQLKHGATQRLHCLVGVVVKASALRATDLGLIPAFARLFTG